MLAGRAVNEKAPIIPEETLRAQSNAANPAASVWVSANAGSGKTHVLTERVIRLLLEVLILPRFSA